MSNNFRSDLAWSESAEHEGFWERTYREAFPEFLNCMTMRGDNEAQRCGIDRIIGLKNGRTIYVEEKQRRQYRPDILLEYQSVDRTAAPGWIEKELKINYLAYAFMDLPLVYLFPWKVLQQAWRSNRADWMRMAEAEEWGFRKVCAGNQGYATWSVAVPIRQLMAALEETALAMHPVLVVGKEPKVTVEAEAVPEFELVPPSPKAVDVISGVLAERPDTRSNVLRLLFAVWERQGLALSPAQVAKVDQLIQPETIRRASRKMMNEEGRFKAA